VKHIDIYQTKSDTADGVAQFHVEFAEHSFLASEKDLRFLANAILEALDGLKFRREQELLAPPVKEEGLAEFDKIFSRIQPEQVLYLTSYRNGTGISVQEGKNKTKEVFVSDSVWDVAMTYRRKFDRVVQCYLSAAQIGERA